MKHDQNSAVRLDEETDLFARMLIDEFASALRDLAQGQAIPAAWRKYLGNALPSKRGIRRTMLERDREIALRVLQHHIELEQGSTDFRITRFADGLAEEYRLEGGDQILKIFGRDELHAASMEIIRRLHERDVAKREARREFAKRIEERLKSGEALEDIVSDPSLVDMEQWIAVRNYQMHGTPLEGNPMPTPIADYAQRRRAIFDWVLDGLARRIDRDSLEAEALNPRGDVPLP